MKKLLIASTLCLQALFGTVALADQPSDDAQKHFQSIATGNLPALMDSYAANAHFNWVGGPLDGTYVGTEPIRSVWEKFTKAQGALKLSVDKIEESANPKGATVTAHVQFEGKHPIKVRYVITYRDAKIVSETWQIDPQLAVGGY